MISNQILQNTIEGLKGITRIDFCVMDTDGKSLASTFSEQENYVEEVLSFVESPADSQVVQGYQFFKIFDEHQLEYILLANGGSDDPDRHPGRNICKRLLIRHVSSRTSGTLQSYEKTCFRTSIRESRSRDQKALQLEWRRQTDQQLIRSVRIRYIQKGYGISHILFIMDFTVVFITKSPDH